MATTGTGRERPPTVQTMHMAEGAGTPPALPVPGRTTADYARRQSNAVVFIAWVVGIFIALSVIGGITAGIVAAHHSQPSCVTVYGDC